MPSISACSRRECNVTSYDVTVGHDSPTTDLFTLTLVDPCNTMSDPCRAKAILMKAWVDLLAIDSQSADVYASCQVNGACPQGGAGLDFNYGALTLQTLVTNSALETAVAAVTLLNVPLPLNCDVAATDIS